MLRVFVEQLTREIHSRGLLLHQQLFADAEFGNIGIRAGGGALKRSPHGEHIQLPVQVVSSLFGGTVDHALRDGQHLTAIESKTVEPACTQKRLDHALVQISRGHTVDEFLKGGKRTVLPLAQDLLDELASHVLQRQKAEADMLARHRKEHTALVDAGRKHANASRGAFGNILRDLGLIAENAGEQGGKIRPWMMAFEIGRAIGNDRVGRGVRFVEGVVGKALHIGKERFGNLSLHASLGRTCEKALALGQKHRRLLLGHGAAHDVGVPKGISRDLAENAHDLLLVDHAAVGGAQDRLEKRRGVGHLFGMMTALDEGGNGIHGSRTVERDGGDDVVQALGREIGKHLPHSRGLKLKDARGLAGGDEAIGCRIVQRNFFHVKVGLLLADLLFGIVNDGQISQSKKIEF